MSKPRDALTGLVTAHRLLLLGLVLMLAPLGCQASLFARRNDEPDPIGLLNDKLVDLTDEPDLRSNVEAAREFKQRPDFEQDTSEPLRKALGLFSELDTGHICGGHNFALLRQLLELASPKQRDEFVGFGSQRRLVRLFQELTFYAKWNCFVVLQLQWANDAQRTAKFEQSFPELVRLEPLLMRRQPRLLSNGGAEQLEGALELANTRDAAKLEKRLSGRKMGAVLRAIHEDKTGLRFLKVDEKSGKPQRLEAQKAAELLHVYLVAPCQRLMGQVEVEELLRPSADLCAIVQVDELTRVGARIGWRSLEWTARFIVCDLLLKLDQQRLAERLAKSGL